MPNSVIGVAFCAVIAKLDGSTDAGMIDSTPPGDDRVDCVMARLLAVPSLNARKTIEPGLVVEIVTLLTVEPPDGPASGNSFCALAGTTTPIATPGSDVVVEPAIPMVVAGPVALIVPLAISTP